MEKINKTLRQIMSQGFVLRNDSLIQQFSLIEKIIILKFAVSCF